MPYYTYILRCSDGTFYVGITNNLARRILQHNKVKRGGAKYTRSRVPVVMQYFEEHETRMKAAKREYQLKKLSHIKKETLCTTFHEMQK